MFMIIAIVKVKEIIDTCYIIHDLLISVDIDHVQNLNLLKAF